MISDINIYILLVLESHGVGMGAVLSSMESFRTQAPSLSWLPVPYNLEILSIYWVKEGQEWKLQKVIFMSQN